MARSLRGVEFYAGRPLLIKVAALCIARGLPALEILAGDSSRQILHLLLQDGKVILGIEGLAGGMADQITGKVAAAVAMNFLAKPLEEWLVIALTEFVLKIG